MDITCRICGNFIISKQNEKITKFVLTANFGFTIDSANSMHYLCQTIQTVDKSRKKCLPPGRPMI